MTLAANPHSKDRAVPELRRPVPLREKPSEKKVIRKIILLFGLLVSAIVGNTMFTTYQENRDASIHTYKDLESKLKMALAIQNYQLRKLETITGIIREQNQRFCEFMDYDNLPAITFMLKSTATIHDIDLAFLFDENGEFLTSYPKIKKDGNDTVFNSLISDRTERVDVEAIPYSIISTHFPEFSSFETKSQALSFKSVSQLVHDTGEIYGYVVLLKLIDGNRQMAEQMARIVEVEVAYFDADKKLVLTSFSNADVPYTERGTMTFDGNTYFLKSAKIEDFLGNTIGTLLTALNKTPFIQHQRRLLINNLTPFFISIIISAALFFLLKTKVFNKINQLIAALRKVAEGEGDLSIRVKVPPKKIVKRNLDEVEHMGVDFNRMMDKLEDTHRQLIKARKEAELASTLKSEFLANMSHEIRTPMNAVIGYTDMLLEGQLSKDQQEYADTIKSSGDTLLTLINDILDFSKIEAGELDFDENDFEPESIVFDVCNIIRPRIEEKPIEIVCRISPRVPRLVHGDPGRFRQVLTNLMGNAPKFTESGEIEISVDVAEEMDERIKLHCRIRDTGIGIPREQLTSIFEPFKQADGTTTRKFGGTGLGLSICKKISNLLGGDVWAESPPGGELTEEALNHSDTDAGLEVQGTGSLFHFTAWFKKVEAVNPEPSIPLSLARKKVLIVDDNATNLDILLVEDNLVNQKLARMMLSKAGFRVDVANNGKEAVQKVTGSPGQYHIVFMDVQMPEMDGIEATKEIRKWESRHTSFKKLERIPIVAMTAHAMKGDREKCIEAGMDDYLTKPIKKKSVLEMAHKWSSRKEIL